MVAKTVGFRQRGSYGPRGHAGFFARRHAGPGHLWSHFVSLDPQKADLLCLFRRAGEVGPWFQDTGRMVTASIVAFAVSAQFVSLVGLEAPYYVALLGAGALKVYSKAASPVGQPVVMQQRVLVAPRLPGFIYH